MRHDFIDHHSHGDSYFHRLAAVNKILIFLLITIDVLFLPFNFPLKPALLIAIEIILLLSTRVPFTHIISKFLKVVWIVLLITLLLPFFGNEPGGEFFGFQ